MRCLVLDGMGVIFAASDDVVELLVPFVRATGGDPAQVETAYMPQRLASLRCVFRMRTATSNSQLHCSMPGPDESRRYVRPLLAGQRRPAAAHGRSSYRAG